MTDVSVSLPAKRKRGRPRKDGNLSREGSFKSPSHLKTQRIEVVSPTAVGIKKIQQVNINSTNGSVDGMVGSMIYGVIEGSFDAGYLISVRIGNNDTPFHGVVFQPGKFVPITAANDVAPQARMYQRREIPVPVYEDPNHIRGFSPQPRKVILQPVPASKQAVLRPPAPSMPLSVTACSLSNSSTFMVPEAIMLRSSSFSNEGGNITIPRSPRVGANAHSPPVHPTGSLRMVEQDDVMQAFEVSSSPKGSNNNKATTGGMISESGKAVESGLGPSMVTHNKQKDSSLQLHHNFMEDMPQSAFGVQQDEMICHEMEHPREYVQSPIIQLQETPIGAQIHSVPREPQPIKSELQPTDPYFSELKCSDVNFPQNLFTGQSQSDIVSKSPNLNLDLASAFQEKKQQASGSCLGTNYLVLNQLKNPNHGYHQALVAGNPLLLPPDLMGEPLEFMLEKGKSQPNSTAPQETNLEVESGVVGSGERFHGDAMSNAEAASSPYKLELATPQSTLNRMPSQQTASSVGCITDMDFVLSDVVQPTESQAHQR